MNNRNPSVKPVPEISELVAALDIQNQSYILNMITTLLFYQSNRENNIEIDAIDMFLG